MESSSTIIEHSAFRNVLQAFARPGTVYPLHESISDRQGALDLLAACILDPECSIGANGPELEPVVSRIVRRTGCLQVVPSLADFVLVGSGTRGDLANLCDGEPDYPDKGSTLVYFVQELYSSGGDSHWNGPGILGSISPRIEGLDDGELDALREANSGYPLGFDALFIDTEGHIMAMPRSTRIERRDGT